MPPTIAELRAASASAAREYQQEILHQTAELTDILTRTSFEAAALAPLLKKFERRRKVAHKRLENYREQLRSLLQVKDQNSPKTFFDFLQSEEVPDHLKLSFYVFFPMSIPFSGKRVVGRIDWNPFQGLSKFFELGMEQARNSRRNFFAQLENAVHNPAGIEDLRAGNLFVLDEAGFNRLLTRMLEKGGGDKLRNLKFKFDGDDIKIEGECKAKLFWVDFKARLRFEVDDGAVSGKLDKIEAAGMDLSSFFEAEILKAFRQFGIAVPAGASLKNLSWIELPGLQRVEVNYNRLVIERSPASAGPS